MSHEQNVPTGALLGALALIVASLALAATARSAHVHGQAPVVQPALAFVDVRFEDQTDGSLKVLDASNGRPIHVVAPGTNGFIRGVLRGMFRGRKLESLGHEGAFRLAREADGRLTLTDPETQRTVDLDSFGPTNAASFAAFLVDARPTP